ncbi:MAG: MotA/TolQ/ExbB proton channel family protein [Phycisphaerales bacterium]|nr:MotA/TolQ/ExbB proton channel family protein [Phycisphaerae bacterium]NNF42265.1 MotA/TolQ/ExbB proton channel family protein [Phycisphaerales bacterium]NNM25763.1 MotA/TolQ/ExbB proton channel family protein [Phycisphaerales bacterium]
MKSSGSISTEFVFQVIALLVAVILVHAVYVTVVRPGAQEALERERAAMASDPDHVAERSLFVVVRDYEQEACFVLMLWAFAIMGYKAVATMRARALLDEDLVPVTAGMRILPEDSRPLQRGLEAMPTPRRRQLLPRALLAALHRFDSARNVQDVSQAAQAICTAEGERLESELSLIRYIAWAIPSVGFIGTVRGIGDALGKAHRAVEGDISGVTESLGVAFNSTLIALIISIVVMFVVHQLQLAQERFVLDAEAYCEEKLIRHLHTG